MMQAIMLVCFVILYSSFGKPFLNEKSIVIKSRTKEILSRANHPQSLQNKLAVEEAIEELYKMGVKNPSRYQMAISSGSWRTIWTTVTSNSIVGRLLGAPASNILGGRSWQVLSKDLDCSENIVLWPSTGIRMAGQARIAPSSSPPGYALTINGLEFRWGADGCPEATGLIGDAAVQDGKRFTALKLDDKTVLRNGVGSLDLLYNDGFIRVTRDENTAITYVHIKEPVAITAAAAKVDASLVQPFLQST